MFKKFQNNSRNKICVILQGKKRILAPGEIITGPEELSHYNGLMELTINGNVTMETFEENVKQINEEEVFKTVDLVKGLDISKPYNNYSKNSKKKTFSIITPTHDKQTYINFVNTLLIQNTDVTFELIPIFNYQKEFSSSTKALNFGMSLANSDYYLLTHQDLLCPKNWIQGYYNHFKNFEKLNINVGFIGMAGASMKNYSQNSIIDALYISNPYNINNSWVPLVNYTRQKYGPYIEVQCLDECVMACKSSLNLKYDEETFNHFHFYGPDICLNALSNGYHNFAIDTDCEHLSDGVQNLMKEEHAKAFFAGGHKLYKKWTPLFPCFRTTCATFLKPENIWLAGIYQHVNRRFNKNYQVNYKMNNNGDLCS